MKYPQELLDLVKAARRERIENKTRENERERKGYVSQRTHNAARKGLPAHLLVGQSRRIVSRDRIIKDPSQGGFAGTIKKRAGMKLTHDTAPQETAASPESTKVEAAIREETARR